MDNENMENQETAVAPETAVQQQASPPRRVWVRILRNRTHAEGCFFRRGARVRVAEDVAVQMVEAGAAVRLPDYFG